MLSQSCALILANPLAEPRLKDRERMSGDCQMLRLVMHFPMGGFTGDPSQKKQIRSTSGHTKKEEAGPSPVHIASVLRDLWDVLGGFLSWDRFGFSAPGSIPGAAASSAHSPWSLSRRHHGRRGFSRLRGSGRRQLKGTTRVGGCLSI